VNPLVQQFSEAIGRRDVQQFENLWLELLEAESIPADDLATLITRLVDSGEGPRAVDLVLALAPELLRANRHPEALPLLRAAAPAAQGNEEVRAGLIDCYRHLHADRPHLPVCLDRSGLLTSPDLAAAAARLEKFLSYREGDYFYHATGWGVGQIVGFDAGSATARIDFEGKPGHVVPLESIESFCAPLQPDDFRVLRKTAPDRLRQLAADDPAALVRKALAAAGRRINLRSLRDSLADVVPPDAWGKWWSSARTALKRDPHVDLGRGSNPLLTLRSEALTYEDEMLAAFKRLKDLTHQTELLREYAAHRAPDADPAAFLLPAARTIAGRLGTERSHGDAFEAAVLLTNLGVETGTFPGPEEILGRDIDPIRLLSGLLTNEARRIAMDLLRRRDGSWRSLCREILLHCPKELWEAAIAELPETGEPPTVESLLLELLASPKGNLDLFAWVARNALLGRYQLSIQTRRVFEEVLTQGDMIARRKADRRSPSERFDAEETLGNLRLTLRAGDLRYFDTILEDTSEIDASRLLYRVRQSSILTATIARALESKIIRKYPKLLIEEDRRETVEPEPLYSTLEGIARHRAEHDQIANVEIPRNSADIRRAAAQGDLSDNADWRAAIQEQQVLNAKVIQIADELLRAQPIEPSMVHTEHVSIGSRVTLEEAATRQQATYVILGPWDTDEAHGIIAYLAPLAQALMRHRIGDEVTLDHAGQQATYRILAVGSALEKKANP